MQHSSCWHSSKLGCGPLNPPLDAIVRPKSAERRGGSAWTSRMWLLLVPKDPRSLLSGCTSFLLDHSNAAASSDLRIPPVGQAWNPANCLPIWRVLTLQRTAALLFLSLKQPLR